MLNGSYLLFYRAGGYGSYWYGERLLVDYPLDFAKAASLYLCSLFYGGVFASGGPDFLARYWPVVALLLLCVAYITYLFLTQRNRFPEISLFTLWIALPLPFIVVPPLNDRLLIIPSIGLAYLAGLAMTRLEKKGLTIFFLVTGLMLPPITNGILAREHDKVLPTSYEHFYAALDRLSAGLKISWMCILYPWEVKESLIKIMALAGCHEVSLGFESGNEGMLSRSLNKKFGPREVRSTSLLLQRHGIRQMGFLLLGGPGETRTTVEESLEFADSLPLDAVKLSAGIRIYPRTPLARLARQEGVIAPDDDLLYPRPVQTDSAGNLSFVNTKPGASGCWWKPRSVCSLIQHQRLRPSGQ